MGKKKIKKSDDEPSIIPSNKALTISASEYCEMAGKNLSDYEAIGLPDMEIAKCERGYTGFYVPDGTEVVVGLQRSDVYDEDIENVYHYYCGTALIQKWTKKRKKRSD